MSKMLVVFFTLSLIIYSIFYVVSYIPKEMVYNYIKRFLVILVAMAVASGILFVIVQLF